MNKTLGILFLSSALALAIELKDAPKVEGRTMTGGGSSTVVLSYHDAVKNIKDSVVNISTQKKVEANAQANPFNNPLFKNNPFFEQFFGGRFEELFPVPKDRIERSLGSGVIVSQDGYIITNNHVIDGADTVMVSIPGVAKEYEAKVVGKDPRSDIAVIKIDAKNLSAVLFADSSNLKEGDLVFAIGNPFGVGESITQGIISALNKSGVGINEYENFIQTDAPINPGNSGGALVDSRGALVGINTAIISRSGGNVGIGFAIPSNMVKQIAAQLIEKGKIERGYVGVTIQDLNEDLKSFYNKDSGAIVTSIVKESPADKAGLKRGDLVVAVDGQNVKDSSELKNLIGSLAPGKTARLTIIRDGKEQTVNVKLAELEESVANETGVSQDGTTFNYKGVSFANIDDALRQRFGMPQNINGVTVVETKESDPKGIAVGDVVLQVESTPVKNIAELKSALDSYKDLQKKRVYIIRKGANLIVTLP